MGRGHRTARGRLVALASSALLLALPCASASASDSASTAAYVRANYALVAGAHAKRSAAEAALQSVLARVRSECPLVVSGSPQDETSEKLTLTLVGTMRLAALHTIDSAISRYARAVAGLRWSNAALTRKVRTYAHELLVQSRLTAPNFCGELRAWKANDYASLPPGAVSFNKAYYAVYVGVGLMPTSELAPSLSAAQRGLVRRTLTLENDVIEFEANAVETWGKIMDAAGLNP